jgi:hypothetical protein
MPAPALWKVEHTLEGPSRWRASLLAGLGAWLLYLSCLSGTVTYDGDSGELIAASYRLGIAHPSGYPFFCLLGRVWASLLPIGEVAWRYNSLCATLGALTVGFVTASAHRVLWTPHASRRALWSSLGAGWLLAGFFYFGSQNVITEVYALNGFFLGAMLWCAVSWVATSDWRWFHALSLTFGFSLTAHLSGVFFAPGLLLLAVWSVRKRFTPFPSFGLPRLVTALALCGAGFTLTLYLPLRSGVFPDPSTSDLFKWWPLDWSHPADFPRWKAHVTAQQYNHLLFAPRIVELFGHELAIKGFAQPLSQWPAKVGSLLSLMALQFHFLTPLVPLGAAWSLRHRAASTCRPQDHGENAPDWRWLGAALALAWALNIGVQINYNVNDVVCFFFPAYIAQAMWMGAGLFAASGWLSARTRQFSPHARWRLTTGNSLLLLGGVALQWIFFSNSASYRGETLARDRALENAQALEELEAREGRAPVAFLFSNDALWSFWYVQYVLDRARGTLTPWSALGSQELRLARMDQVVARIKSTRQSPVAVAQWDQKLDARFPLVPLSPSGSLWTASDRQLPLPARPLAGEVSPGPLLGPARFRRAAINRGDLSDFALKLDDHEPLELWLQRSLEKEGLARIKRGTLAAFDLDFARPAWPVLRASASESAAHIGYAQVLLARRGTFSGDPPSGDPPSGTVRRFVPRGGVPVVHSTDPFVAAYTQTRRLVVPLSSRAGAGLRATIAIEIHPDAPSGLYDVWARLVRSADDSSTSWQKRDLAAFVHH